MKRKYGSMGKLSKGLGFRPVELNRPPRVLFASIFPSQAHATVRVSRGSSPPPSSRTTPSTSPARPRGHTLAAATTD